MRFGNATTVVALGEDLPEEHNRVELHAALTDSSGIAAPKVSYRVSENSVRMMAHACRQAETVLGAAGAHTVKATPLLRMGEDPRRSVVDGSCRAHDVDNLYVVDGSVFVTGASVNPTPTLQAIALRAADHIRKVLNP